MKVILMVMLQLGLLHLFAPTVFRAQRAVANARNEFRNALAIYDQTSEQSADYRQVLTKLRMAAIHESQAEAEYRKLLLQSIYGL